MAVQETTFKPKVPYEEGQFSLEGKQFFTILTIMGIVLMIVGILGLIHQISLEGAFSNTASGIILIVMGYGCALLSILPIFVLKSAYNDFYPQGNWYDYLKRNWNDFTDAAERKRFDDLKEASISQK